MAGGHGGTGLSGDEGGGLSPQTSSTSHTPTHVPAVPWPVGGAAGIKEAEDHFLAAVSCPGGSGCRGSSIGSGMPVPVVQGYRAALAFSGMKWCSISSLPSLGGVARGIWGPTGQM